MLCGAGLGCVWRLPLLCCEGSMLHGAPPAAMSQSSMPACLPVPAARLPVLHMHACMHLATCGHAVMRVVQGGPAGGAAQRAARAHPHTTQRHAAAAHHAARASATGGGQCGGSGHGSRHAEGCVKGGLDLHVSWQCVWAARCASCMHVQWHEAARSACRCNPVYHTVGRMAQPQDVGLAALQCVRCGRAWQGSACTVCRRAEGTGTEWVPIVVCWVLQPQRACAITHWLACK